MAFSFDEKPSRKMTTSPPTEVREYVADGETDPDVVRAYALTLTPSMISTVQGLLYRQDVSVSEDGYSVFSVTVPYSPRKREVGQMSIDFDTMGATQHIDNSGPFGGTIAAYDDAGPIANPGDLYGNTIGFQSDEKVDGCDRVMPSLKFSIRFRHPLGVISIPQMKQIARATGTVNLTTFLTFDPGEVLFLGASGSEGTDTETEITYHFDASENVSNLDVGDIVVVTKNGHDFAWVRYVKQAVAGKPSVKPDRVLVERIYKRKNLAAILGFGG
jgi:hypothetical protein